MHMDMRHRLPSDHSIIDAHVVSLRTELMIQSKLGTVKQRNDSAALQFGKIEE